MHTSIGLPSLGNETVLNNCKIMFGNSDNDEIADKKYEFSAGPIFISFIDVVSPKIFTFSPNISFAVFHKIFELSICNKFSVFEEKF